jgi:hypothetical protein
MIRHEVHRSVAGLLSLSSNRYTIKSILALALLGVVIVFHQLLLLNQGYDFNTAWVRNGSDGVSTTNFGILPGHGLKRTLQLPNSTLKDQNARELYSIALLVRMALLQNISSSFASFFWQSTLIMRWLSMTVNGTMEGGQSKWTARQSALHFADLPID